MDDPPNDVGRYPSIAIGADGLPVISYYDNTAETLKVARCANADCTGAATITTVHDAANDVGAYGAIAIGADGLPVIRYVFEHFGADHEVEGCILERQPGDIAHHDQRCAAAGPAR